MKTYSEYRPTGFDRAGAFLPERGDWLVLPIGRNRGADCLSESNFQTVVDSLGGESETLEIHRFGHWAVGWFEIALLHPSRKEEGDAIEKALADYPVFNEEDNSNREYARAAETWSRFTLADRIDYCHRFKVSIFAARRSDEIPERIDVSILAE